MPTEYLAWKWRYFDPVRRKHFNSRTTMSEEQAAQHFAANGVVQFEKTGPAVTKKTLTPDEYEYTDISAPRRTTE